MSNSKLSAPKTVKFINNNNNNSHENGNRNIAAHSTASSPTSATGSNTVNVTKEQEDIRKQITFVLNQITDLNLDDSCRELREVFTNSIEIWIQKVLVFRCKNESNLIEIYAKFIMKMSEFTPDFHQLMIEGVKNEVDHILRGSSIDIKQSKQLKNLGILLGLLTIAKDIHVCIDLNELLRDCYQNYNESVEFLLPFICGVLKGIKTSKLVTKYHPWSQEILSIMRELYSLTNKVAIQFEIELLFNHLDCTVNDINAAFYLRHNPLKMHPCNYAKSAPN